MMQTNWPVAVNGEGRSGEGGGLGKRGTKRDASDSNLSDFDRFEKRLRMLTLRSEQNGKEKNNLYAAVSNALSAPTPAEASHEPTQGRDEMMQLDDTRDRVYIHDLDAELDDGESDQEKLIFLPDIEKHFSKIPQQVLTGGQDGNQELVLYSVPKSLTVDENHDSVRKAILETRHRAREKAAEEARQADMDRTYNHSQFRASLETAHGYNGGYLEEEPEIDAMDID